MSKIKHKFAVLNSIIKDDISLTKDFGINFGFLHFFMKVICGGSKTRLGRFLYKYMYELIESKCAIEYKSLIDEYKLTGFNVDGCTVSKDSNIWIFWWQGIENAPEIVRKCIETIRYYSESHKVIIVTEKNISQFVDIPKYILEKVNNGSITLTHFSDILRLELLYQYGGIWMDSTLLMTGDIPVDVYKLPFFTIKHMKYSDYHVCRGLWSGFFLCAAKNNKLVKFCRDFLYEYWKHEDSLICYLLIDVAFCLAYDNFEWAKKMIDDVPVNCTDVFSMQENMNREYDEKLVEKWCKNTFVHKISYKIPFDECVNGKNTYWKNILLR